MRIVHEDPKLGISKVVWRFAEESDPTIPPQAAPSATEAEGAEPVSGLEAELVPEQTDAAKAETAEQAVSAEDIRGAAAVPQGHLDDLRLQIRFLQQVIESQNQQLKTKDELIRNFQVLLKAEQEQVMQLEARRPEKSPEAAGGSSLGGWFQTWFSRMKKQ